MKKIKLLSIMCFMTLLASCGNTTSDNTSNGGSNISPWWTTTGELSFDSDNKVVFNDVDIELATVVTGDDLPRFKNIVERFNSEHMGKIHVNVNAYNQNSFEQTIGQKISQNDTPPDLIMSHQKAHRNFADSKLIQPFDEAFEKGKINFDISNFANNVASYSNLGYEGYQFQIPIDAQSQVLFYNKELLTQINGGILPNTRSDLINLLETAKTRMNDATFYGISGSTTDRDYFNKYTFLTAYIQNGGELYNTSTYKAEWTNENNTKAFNDAISSINELIDKEYFKYNEGLSAALTRFCRGKSLFLLAEPWLAETIFKNYAELNSGYTIDRAKEEIGGFSVAKMFALDDSNANSEKIFGDSHAFLMASTVKDINVKAACAYFCKWYTEDVQAGVDWANAGHISASKIISNANEYQEDAFIKEYISNFYLDIDKFVTIGNNPYYSDIINALYDIAANVTNKNSISNLISSKQQDYNDMIDLRG